MTLSACTAPHTARYRSSTPRARHSGCRQPPRRGSASRRAGLPAKHSNAMQITWVIHQSDGAASSFWSIELSNSLDVDERDEPELAHDREQRPLNGALAYWGVAGMGRPRPLRCGATLMPPVTASKPGTHDISNRR